MSMQSFVKFYKAVLDLARLNRASTDGRTDGQTDGRTDSLKPVYPPLTSSAGGINMFIIEVMDIVGLLRIQVIK